MGAKLILFGFPGAGKGTIGELLQRRLSIRRFSTGDAYRDEVKRRTAFGKRIAGFMRRNAFVPDRITIAYTLRQLAKPEYRNGFVLDGFPRTVAQALALDRQFTITKAIYLEVPHSLVVRRLSARRVCASCGAVYNLVTSPPRKGVCDACSGKLVQRADDKLAAIQRRIRDYHVNTAPLASYYEMQGKLLVVDASRSPAVVGRAIMTKLRS